MAKKPVRAPLGRSLNASVEPSGLLTVPVIHVAGISQLRIDGREVRGAERSFPVDCAHVRERHGLCEFVFIQLDPYEDGRVARVASVRYTRDRFVERARQNEEFRLGLETVLTSSSAGRGTPGHYTKLAAESRPGPGQSGYSALIDAEADIMMYASTRSAIIFLTATSPDVAAVARGDRTTLSFLPELEVTMSTHALADFLGMWKTLAGIS
ncbi:MAG: hypothetical protein ACRELY_26620 [Polyangiaceae bacterium]